MKAFLMHRDRDFDLERPSPGIEADLKKDLALETLVVAMANGDPIVFEVAQKALLAGVGDAWRRSLTGKPRSRTRYETPRP